MKRQCWVFVALVWLAFVLRLRDIDRYDLWYDEAGQALAALRPTLSETLEVVRKHYGASPLSYLLTYVTIRLAGTSELALRFEPLVWSVLAVALTMRTARAISSDSNHPEWAGLLAAISPLAIRYAQEVRFYALGLMWASAVFCFLVLVSRGQIHPSKPAWLGLVGLVAALLYSHVYAAFILLPSLLVALLLIPAQKRLRLGVWTVSAWGLAGVMFVPWLLFGMKIARHPFAGHTVSSDILHPILAGLELIPLAQQPSLELPGGSLFALVILVLSVLGIIHTLWVTRREPWLLGGLVGMGLSIAAVCAANFGVGYFFQPRQFLFLQPVRLLVIGSALARASALAPEFMRFSFAASLIALSVAYTQADLHRAERARVRPAAQVVVSHLQQYPSAPILIVPYWLHITPEYYLRKWGVNVVWQRFPDDKVTPERLSSVPPRALVVIAGRRTDFDSTLHAAGFEEATPTSTPNLSFRVWVKHAPSVP